MGQEGSRALPIPSGPEIVEDLLNPRERPWLYSAKEDKAKPWWRWQVWRGWLSLSSPQIWRAQLKLTNRAGQPGTPNTIGLLQEAASTCPPLRHRGFQQDSTCTLVAAQSICYWCWSGIRLCSSSPQLFQSPLWAWKGMLGALSYKNLPVLPQMSTILLQWLSCSFFLHSTHSNKRRKRCCVISRLVLHPTALHTCKVDFQVPASPHF